MIEENKVVSHVRFFDEGKVYYDPYDAILTIQWLTTTYVYISGFKGNVTIKMYKDFLSWCKNNNIKTISYHRSPFKKSTLGDNVHSLTVVDVEQLHKEVTHA